MKEIESFVRRTIATLDRDDPYSRAACAKLRRAVGRPLGECPDVWEIILPNAPEGKNSDNVIHTVVTLYALHSQGKNESMSDNATGFGAAIAKLIDPSGSNESAVRRRFNAVATSSEFTELAHHARGLIQLLKASGVKMDYPRFASDLYYFQFPDNANTVRLKWGKQFYHVNISQNLEGTDEE